MPFVELSLIPYHNWFINYLNVVSPFPHFTNYSSLIYLTWNNILYMLIKLTNKGDLSHHVFLFLLTVKQSISIKLILKFCSNSIRFPFYIMSYYAVVFQLDFLYLLYYGIKKPNVRCDFLFYSRQREAAS